MNLRWIEDFLELCETRSFSEAAKRRFLTQSALSKHIKALEHWLGSEELIDRSSNPVTLTETGIVFRDKALQIVALLNLVRREVNSSSSTIKNVYISAPHVLSVTFFPIISQLLSDFGTNICLRIIANNYKESVTYYESARCDFLLCYDANYGGIVSSHDDYKMLLGRDYLAPVSIPGGQGKPKFDISNVQEQEISYLSYSEETYLGSVLKKHRPFIQLASRLRRKGESTYAESLRAGVTAGLGLAWLPLGLIETDLKNGELMIAGSKVDCIPLEIMLYRKRNVQRKEVNEVWDILHTQTGNNLIQFELVSFKD